MENKSIRVRDFVNKYKLLKNEDMRKNMVKAYIKNPNFGFSDKCFLANTIVEQSYLKGKVLHIDSCKCYYLHVMCLLTNYTTLIFSTKDVQNDYDLLNSCGALEDILSMIDKKEISEFKTILDMKCNDAVMNYVSEKDMLLTMMKSTMSDASEIMKNIDQEQIGKIMEMVSMK